MSFTRISAALVTDMKNNVDKYTVLGADAANLEQVNIDWSKWNGYYKKIPEIQSVIDRKAMWVVGRGYKADARTKNILDKIRGNGKDTFDSIMYNAVRVYTICGNFFAEIIENKRGELRNLKPLDSGTITILGNSKGMIKAYAQVVGTVVTARFKPDQIFHLSWNRIADHLEGISTIEKLEDIIIKRNEALNDMRIVFHRYVKPLLVTSVDTDDATEIEAFKTKLDKAVNLGENIVVPKDTVDKMERISIPQYSTLDPLPWVQLLTKYFITSEGVPEVVLGSGEQTTEASAKILYLAFQQMVEWNQLFLEQQIKAQLGLDVEFNFPASIEPSLISDQNKDKNIKSMPVNPAKSEN